MIGRLRGTLLEKGAEGVVLEVGGVGYELACPLTVVDRLPRVGQDCALVVHTHVREDALVLFGFVDADERQLFRQLIAVSGVGPKLALACLSGMDAVALGNALADKDVKKLSGVPGIGKRTAERLILELEGKVQSRRASPAAPTGPVRNPDLDDLDSALRNLGYKARDVDLLIEGLRPQAAGMSFEGLLREALRRLNGG